MLSIVVAVLAALMVSGIPIALALFGAALVAIVFASDLPVAVVAQRMVAQVDSFTLMAVPFFVLAGAVMEQGGISRRLIHFAGSLVGHFRSGLAAVCVVSSFIFAGVSGSSAADATAIGAVLIPAMLARGYDRGFVASLQAASATMGPIVPPSSLAIIYGSIANVSIGKLFAAGIVPGALMAIVLLVATHLYARRLNFAVEPRATWAERARSFVNAFWALMVPVVILGGILSGVFTATESGAVAAIYALIVAMVIYRELKLKDLRPVLLQTAMTTSMVMIVIGAAGSVSWILASENVPQIFRAFLLSVSTDPWVILFLILGIMLAIGCVMEIVAAAIIMIPIIYPIARAAGFDDVHVGLLVMMTMALGAVTPPVGVTLFICLGIAKTNLGEVNRYIWPLVGALVVVVILCAIFPPLVTIVPALIFGP